MRAKEAIPLLELKILELEAEEESWKNCKSCPFSGKCCDGAPLIIWPEEKEEIVNYLRMHEGIKKFALSRYKKNEKCYFYDRDAKACLIHAVRPLNCRWTPYTVFHDPNSGYSGMIRDSNCNFYRMTKADLITRNKNGLIEIKTAGVQGGNSKYIVWQEILELYPLMRRSNELVALESLMEEMNV